MSDKEKFSEKECEWFCDMMANRRDKDELMTPYEASLVEKEYFDFKRSVDNDEEKAMMLFKSSLLGHQNI